MHVRAQQDAFLRERIHVDVRVDTALTDQLQLREPFDQRLPDRRALADQHERFGVLQALGQRVGVFRVIVPDRYVVAFEFPERVEGPNDVLVVVEDGNFHLESVKESEE